MQINSILAFITRNDDQTKKDKHTNVFLKVSRGFLARQCGNKNGVKVYCFCFFCIYWSITPKYFVIGVTGRSDVSDFVLKDLLKGYQ